ncbi:MULTISPECIES: RrF2 family transcriptional regulator [Paenibacillus]|jgi:Rrf2 family transcriptional regulator, repressor of oqxAB|uniref:RrF2 family transcriptional regulator n=1 Tax=Paenibacillus TaxID=44249 RepID=UPI0004F6D4D1|nr:MULTISPECIES: Rrf2 family transcriptional regulator [unclassified Paenibacillus]AIQ27729.1 Rrf2 family transcriptional regulator [Paenibacillus sp. FSL P4-0081]OMF22995.1 transcriptional regulator [Paenibacillus sp. FSL H8-0259]
MAKTRNSGAPQYKSFGLVLQALVILAKKGSTCSSCEIAGLLSSEATLLRRLMANLTRERILVTREGRDGGYLLNRAPEELTLAEIYQAMEAGEGRDNGHSDTICVNALGTQMKVAYGELLDELDQSALRVLERYTLADMVRKTED